MKIAAAGSAQLMASQCLPTMSWAGSKKGKRAAVLGGGVAGMTAAHELMERGFEVTVFEAKDEPGGKARSMLVPESGTGGRADLPGEHGFRFFPGFYKHLPDTMRRIPYRGQPDGTLGNLVHPSEIEIARKGLPPITVLSRPAQNCKELRDFITNVLGSHLGVGMDEALFFAGKIEAFLTSCDDRRLYEFEQISWWDYIEASKKSQAYQKFFAQGITRCLVAAQAKLMSARTGIMIFTQLLFNIMGVGGGADRVLNGPTSEVWIAPWLEHLRKNGVDYRLGCRVQRVEAAQGKVTGAWVLENGRSRLIEADHFVMCLPLELVGGVVSDELVRADPQLGRIGQLATEYMAGAQLYLRRDVRIARGHCILIDSPWAVTVFSQPQFWGGVDLSGRGNGEVRGLLSIDISDWKSPGVVFGKPARECSRDELFEEIWAQLTMHLEKQPGVELTRDDLIGWFLDPGITFPSEHEARSDDPLHINTPGSWWNRPEAVRPVRNLFLAGDYVRTYTDLASMEAANEAARRAVNGVLAASGSSEDHCTIWPLEEPAVFAPGKALDQVRFDNGLPHLDQA